MKISVILPAYKEAENLEKILPGLHAALKKMNVPYEILVVDTMEAMDGTPEICRKHACTYLRRRGGNMYGDAMRTGIAEASGEYIVVMDADGSHEPKIISKFYHEVTENGFDLVIGSRYCKGGNSHNGPILKFMSWILNVTYRIIFHLDVKDVSDSFRMYRAGQLKALELECENFDIVEEILIRLSLKFQDIRIKEVPIYFNKRVYGESKRDLFKFIKSYLKTIRRLLKIRSKEKRG